MEKDYNKIRLSTLEEVSRKVDNIAYPGLKWQDESTAPLDQPVVIYTGIVYEERDLYSGMDSYMEVIVGIKHKEGWREAGSECMIIRAPTHWLPLPQAPRSILNEKINKAFKELDKLIQKK